MKEFKVKEIRRNSFFTKTVFLDQGFIVLTPEMPFAEEMAGILEKWSFNSIYSDGEPQSQYIGNNTDTAASSVSSINLSQQPNSENLGKAQEYYSNLLFYVDSVFVKASISDELDFKSVMEKIREMVEYIKEDRRGLLMVMNNTEPLPGKNYTTIHSIRSAVYSIIIGTYLKLPQHRLIELGVAALVHELGMLKLPSNVYLKERLLSPQEQKAMMTHPILGYSLLKSHDFPLTICLAALEHHERENAGGYPRRLTGEKINLYSKIIAVVCSYEALITKRPHKEPKNAYTAMLELLKNEGKQYNDTVVRAFANSISIYPIGLYVLLSNDKKGQVIDVDPENSRHPVVQIFGEHTPDGKNKIAQITPGVLTIVRPLNKSEIEN
ncbi:MAG: HD-GYP domain-containing protein [Treponema sp.]|jgi:HD-GYP domain-containing protein (c-di-GMP phosphodiesterase class II)|nr:HD-GYP domain-containing protein [Treponema sp.]